MFDTKRAPNTFCSVKVTELKCFVMVSRLSGGLIRSAVLISRLEFYFNRLVLPINFSTAFIQNDKDKEDRQRR